MKTRVLIGVSLSLGLALMAPVGASAQTTPAVDPMALGSLDAVLKFCKRLNPGGTAAYSALKISTIGQQSAATLAALEATPQYKSAFSKVHSVMVNAPRDWARQSCLDLVGGAGIG